MPLVVDSYRPKPIKEAQEESASSEGRGRKDGRMHDEMKPMYMSVGNVTRAAGSCYMEAAGTKVLCSIYGPSAGSPDLREYSDSGKFVCDFKFAPFATEERRPAGQGDDERDLSTAVTEAFSHVILLEKYPKSIINAYITVLEAAGGVLGVAICCASMALADAGIECKDLVAAAGVARVAGSLLLDLLLLTLVKRMLHFPLDCSS